MNSKEWFVVRENLVWQYCHELNCKLWVSVSREQVTQGKSSQESANNDFEKLGFKLKPGMAAQCNDNITPEQSWVRHIVQCRKIF